MESGVKKVIGLRREVPARRKDGHEFAVELGVKEINSDEYGIQGRAPSSGTDTRRFFCAFLKDISHEKKHEADMQHRVDLMQGMIDSSFDPMFQIDEKGIKSLTLLMHGIRDSLGVEFCPLMPDLCCLLLSHMPVSEFAFC